MKMRLALVAGAYIALAGIGALAWDVALIGIGVLAVIPLLVIAYYTSLPAALFTALGIGVLFTLLEQHAIPGAGRIVLSPPVQSAVLTVALCTVVIVAEVLRRYSVQNVLLRESLKRAYMQAERDPLTGIANRAAFLRRLREALKNPAVAPVAVLFADLDGFKAVNDTAGHNAGDTVLVLAAERLSHAVRGNDVVARIGGDEFAVLLHHAGDRAEVDAIMEKIEQAFSHPFALGDRRFSVGITVGMSRYPEDGEEAEVLLRVSDTRMYAKK
jgi:diguanylate cyclase (GGDEF)-like protein